MQALMSQNPQAAAALKNLQGAGNSQSQATQNGQRLNVTSAPQQAGAMQSVQPGAASAGQGQRLNIQEGQH
jgi:hypothetical protein